MGRLKAFASGLPTRQSEASPVASACLPSRPGPKSGVGCRLTTLLILLHCQVSRSVRVPALSVGAGEGNPLANQRRLQVPKLNGVQVTDGKQGPTHKWNRCVKRSFMPACNRAIRHCQAQPLCLCTSRFIQIPEECVAADHRCLVPSADRMPAAATFPILGWDGPRWAPAPRMLRDVFWVLTLRPSGSQPVSARKLCSGNALRPDLSWVLNYTVPSVPSKGHLQFTGLQGAERGPQCAPLGLLAVQGAVRGPQCALLGPLQFSGLRFVQRNTMMNARCHNRWL